MANVKVKKESTSNGGGMITGIIIVACILVGIIIWKFVMGSPANFEGGNPERNWTAFYDAPRYSSGYAALFQTMAFMPETHMLKPYPQRVEATYQLMVTMMEFATANLWR